MSSDKYPSGTPKEVFGARVVVALLIFIAVFTQAPALVSAASTLAVFIGFGIVVAGLWGLYAVLIQGKLDVFLTNLLEKVGIL